MHSFTNEELSRYEQVYIFKKMNKKYSKENILREKDIFYWKAFASVDGKAYFSRLLKWRECAERQHSTLFNSWTLSSISSTISFAMSSLFNEN